MTSVGSFGACRDVVNPTGYSGGARGTSAAVEQEAWRVQLRPKRTRLGKCGPLLNPSAQPCLGRLHPAPLGGPSLSLREGGRGPLVNVDRALCVRAGLVIQTHGLEQ